MNEQEEIDRQCDMQLSAMRALLGHVTPNIRAVSLKWNEPKKIGICFVFESEIREEDLQNVEEVRKKIHVDFPTDIVTVHCVQAPQQNPGSPGSAVFIKKLD